MKYKCDVGSFCTRFVSRQLTIYANTEEEAKEKAIDRFVEVEYKRGDASDAGSPQVDSIEAEKERMEHE